jgi:DNA-directed RNA polymerase specialized sigma24 family protein
MKVFQEFSYRQIADELGISTKTVEKHISKGLKDTHAYMRRRYQMPDRERQADG